MAATSTTPDPAGGQSERSSAAAATSEGCLPHPPISITERVGPEGFEWMNPVTGEREHRPGSGVTAGSGTAEDPYVIEGWCVAGYPTTGISIETTTAHVVLRENVIGVSPSPDESVAIEDASNVVVEDNEIIPIHAYDNNVGYGIMVRDSTDVVVRDNDLLRAGDFGILAVESTSVLIEGNDVDAGVEYGIYVTHVEDVRIENNGVRDNHNTGIEVRHSDAVIVQGNMVEANGFGISVVRGNDNVVQENEVKDSELGVAVSGESQSNLVENNDITDNGHGVWLYGTTATEIEANEIRGNERGIFSNGTADLSVHGNNIEENTEVGLKHIDSDDPVDATHNWWGCSDGPSDPACNDVEGEVLFTPWRSEPNPEAGTG